MRGVISNFFNVMQHVNVDFFFVILDTLPDRQADGQMQSLFSPILIIAIPIPDWMGNWKRDLPYAELVQVKGNGLNSY